MALEAVTDATAVDAGELLALYEDHEWWADRSREDVARALANTDILVGLRDDERLVAAARVLTDGVYYGRVYDVVVAADRRREGLGETLMREVVDHPDLRTVDTLHLDCRPGLVPFYERAGFAVRDLDVEFETMVRRTE